MPTKPPAQNPTPPTIPHRIPSPRPAKKQDNPCDDGSVTRAIADAKSDSRSASDILEGAPDAEIVDFKKPKADCHKAAKCAAEGLVASGCSQGETDKPVGSPATPASAAASAPTKQSTAIANYKY